MRQPQRLIFGIAITFNFMFVIVLLFRVGVLCVLCCVCLFVQVFLHLRILAAAVHPPTRPPDRAPQHPGGPVLLGGRAQLEQSSAAPSSCHLLGAPAVCAACLPRLAAAAASPPKPPDAPPHHRPQPLSPSPPFPDAPAQPHTHPHTTHTHSRLPGSRGRQHDGGSRGRGG